MLDKQTNRDCRCTASAQFCKKKPFAKTERARAFFAFSCCWLPPHTIKRCAYLDNCKL